MIRDSFEGVGMLQGRMAGTAGCTLAKQRSLQLSQEPGYPIVGRRILNVNGSIVGQVIFKIPQALWGAAVGESTRMAAMVSR